VIHAGDIYVQFKLFTFNKSAVSPFDDKTLPRVFTHSQYGLTTLFLSAQLPDDIHSAS
jgi:hypothetical protein